MRKGVQHGRRNHQHFIGQVSKLMKDSNSHNQEAKIPSK
jgi:hypothetical protein